MTDENMFREDVISHLAAIKDAANDIAVHAERSAVVHELEVLLKYAALLGQNKQEERDEFIKHITIRLDFIKSHTKNIVTDGDE